MKVLQAISRLAILAALCALVAEPAFAQRGEGRGGGGRGGGQGVSQGGGGRGGGGGQRGGRSGGQGRRGVSSGQGRGPSQGESMRRTFRQGDRGGSIQQRSGGQQQAQQRQQAQRQQSFFRGPDEDRFRTQDQRGRDAFPDRGRTLDQARRAEPDRSFREGRDLTDRDRTDRDWRGRVFGDSRTDRDVRDFDRDRRDLTRDGRDSDRDRRDFVGDDRDLDRDFTRDDRRFDRDDRDFDRRRLSFRRDDWSRTANRIRDDWRRRDGDRLPFRYGWWDNWGGRTRWPVVSPWRYSWWRDRPYYWWGWTSAPLLTDWIVYGWNRPYYWNYGPGGNIYYRDNYVYYDGQRYLPANQYYEQVYELAHSVPSIDASEAERMEWKPLGVFAAIPNNDESQQRTIQLAVNKNGVLSGTYYNPQNDQVHPLLGMVDDRTQRAAFAFADGENKDLVFETSIYNLTESESTMMVHFGPNSDDTEIWQLVRLERPESSGEELPLGQGSRSAQRYIP